MISPSARVWPALYDGNRPWDAWSAWLGLTKETGGATLYVLPMINGFENPDAKAEAIAHVLPVVTDWNNSLVVLRRNEHDQGRPPMELHLVFLEGGDVWKENRS